ncbi:MAG: FAD-dependent monooxygenase [Phycisphaeraceae bacterium]|nr:FAD-dependent monooxygenase [Phycisphaeraceae bacterium]
MTPQVLIVGAGPTGLVLALFLRHLSIPFRIIDKLSGPGQASRAMVIQARTLEFYRQIGFADKCIDAGIKMRGIRLREQGKQIAGFRFDQIGDDISPYPFVLSLPQDDHEHLLVAELQALGVDIEWSTELTHCENHDSHVRTTLRNRSGDETIDFRFLCACDGARSTVRETLGFGFPGGTYDEVFYVTDVDARGLEFDDSVNISVSKGTFILAFPVRSKGSYRFIGIVPPDHPDPTKATFEDIRPIIRSQLNAEVQAVHWFSAYRVHHRVAQGFRRGSVFLSGDAGHIHSPAGGQGMNTGIGDAVNLAWKLAAVLEHRAAPEILDTYESERMGFARTLVDTTDRIFEAVVGPGVGPGFVRSVLFPFVFPLLLKSRAIRRAQFRLVSQVRIQYHSSALSRGKSGKLKGGDRLPWLLTHDNFAPLRSLDWQLHAFGSQSENTPRFAKTHNLAYSHFPFDSHAADAGFSPTELYLVRPDGHIGLIASEEMEVHNYLRHWNIRAR